MAEGKELWAFNGIAGGHSEIFRNNIGCRPAALPSKVSQFGR